MNKLWEFKPDGKNALRHSARFLRSTILPAVSQPGPMSAYPGTMVLAEQRIHRHGCWNSRQIFYVDCADWHCDGLWLPNIGRKHRDSLVVDASTLGPKGPSYHKASWAERRNFRRHRSLIAARWRAELAENTPCEMYRSWWQSSVSWLTGKWSNSTAAALRSECEIVATIKIPHGLCQWQGIPAVKEAWFYPTIPNEITEFSLGGHNQVLAFARISAPMQSDARLTKWAQRVFYVPWTEWAGDRKNLITPPDDWNDYVSTRNITPGVLAESFDPRDLDGRNLGTLAQQRDQFYKQLESNHDRQ